MGNLFSKILLFFILSAAVVAASTGSTVVAEDVSGELAVTREQLEAIEREITTLRLEVQRLAAQENSVLSLLHQLDLQIRMKKQEIELLTFRLLTTEQEIARLKKQLEELKANQEKQKQYLSRRLVEAYKLGQLNYVKLMLLVNTTEDVLRSYQYLSFLAKDDFRRLEEYKDSLAQMQETSIRLQQENRNLVRLRQDTEQAQKDLLASRNEKVRLLAAIQNQREIHLNALSELRVAASQLQSFFSNVLPQQTSARGKSMAHFRGLLDWPVRGKVIRDFGTQKHPRFSTTTVSNGIEIAAGEGTEVMAVYDGEVVFAEWFKGYGKCIILVHPGGYHSLYAHNSELLVQRGDFVTRGQVIARTGSTGSLTGSNLYFEIREKEKPVNPLYWLRNR